MALDPTTAPASVNFGAGSTQFGVLAAGQWQVSSTAACWIAVGLNPTATAHAAGSVFVPANYPVTISVLRAGFTVAVTQDTVGGWASLTANV